MFKIFCCFQDEKILKDSLKENHNIGDDASWKINKPNSDVEVKNVDIVEKKIPEKIQKKNNGCDTTTIASSAESDYDSDTTNFTILDKKRIKVSWSVFDGCSKMGDFNWEIMNNIEPRTLYIFNDNEEHHATSIIGGGNAVIRRYNEFGYQNTDFAYPRSAGVCTGKLSQGYKQLDKIVKQKIDDCISEIKIVLKTDNYDCIKYSAQNRLGELGTSIFRVGDDVKKYIVSELKKLETF